MKGIKEILDNALKEYVKKWRVDATFFYNNGMYNWMNSHIKEYKTVLEIGCGSGLSTLSLIENGHNVIVVDENYKCLEATKKTLSDKGIKARVIKRQSLFREYKDSYDYQYIKINNKLKDNEVLLIEGDVLKDTNLEKWLEGISINCIVCWLIGTHTARKYNKNINNIGIHNNSEYRLYVQNTIYEMADKLLDKGGAVHIVDRGQMPKSDREKEEFYSCHKEQAEPTALQVVNIDFKGYQHNIENGTQMVKEDGNTIEKVEGMKDSALFSVVSIKM